VDYVIYKLGKRVNNPSWIVALKALMTFHRLLRECDASFAEQVRASTKRQQQHSSRNSSRNSSNSAAAGTAVRTSSYRSGARGTAAAICSASAQQLQQLCAV
jgi:hypothetical protein